MRFRATSLVLLAALFGALTAAAHADTVTYSFTGASALAGTNFTYVDTAGFLAFDTGKLTPTTATDLIAFGVDYGPLTGFDFTTSLSFSLTGNTTVGAVVGSPYQIGAVTTGESLGGPGTLVITDTPSVATTPEPSSLALLGTGVLGLAGAVRRRFLTA